MATSRYARAGAARGRSTRRRWPPCRRRRISDVRGRWWPGARWGAKTRKPTAMRRGVRRGREPAILVQSADVVDDVPAVVVRKVLPGRHRAATIGDLPEELAVRLRRDLRRRPVRGLRRRQRGRGRAIALAGPVAGLAVGVDVLLRVGQRLLVRLLGGPRVLGGLGVRRGLPLALRPHGRAGADGNQGRTGQRRSHDFCNASWGLPLGNLVVSSQNPTSL